MKKAELWLSQLYFVTFWVEYPFFSMQIMNLVIEILVLALFQCSVNIFQNLVLSI